MAELSPSLEHFLNANSAALGGILATTFTYPIDTLNKKIVNANEGENKSAGAIIKKILAEQGPGGFFKGLPPKLLWSYGGKFLFYGMYSFLKLKYEAMMGHPFTFAHDLIAGYLSEWSTLPVAVPFEAVATRLQSSTAGIGEIVNGILKEQGFFGMYSGLSAYWVLCITPAITNTLFSQIKTFVMSKRDSKTGALSTSEAFFYGALARGIATIIMYPYLKAKTILQSTKKAGVEGPEKSATEVVVDTFKEKGILALYDGLTTELMRGVLSSAVTMMFKERIYAFTRITILALTAQKALKAKAALKL